MIKTKTLLLAFLFLASFSIPASAESFDFWNVLGSFSQYLMGSLSSLFSFPLPPEPREGPQMMAMQLVPGGGGDCPNPGCGAGNTCLAWPCSEDQGSGECLVCSGGVDLQCGCPSGEVCTKCDSGKTCGGGSGCIGLGPQPCVCSCPSGYICTACSCQGCAQCQPLVPALPCGDGVCDIVVGETCASCQSDCGFCCGNGSCDAWFGETYLTCGDCAQPTLPCGNGFCGDVGEDCATCPTDCGSCCGDGFCALSETSVTCSSDCPPIGCGNNSCEVLLGETCVTCSNDCGSCCGNGFCDTLNGETYATCPGDCPLPQVCGDLTCQWWNGENCSSCPVDCGTCPLGCPDGGCEEGETPITCPLDCGCGNGSCGDTTQVNLPTGGGVTWWENCQNCPLDCGTCPITCPNGYCDIGEDYLTCPTDCPLPGPPCGNGLCETGENCLTCALDCGTCCGDGACTPMLGEACATCPGDCGVCCGNETCEPEFGETYLTCPDCPPVTLPCGNGSCDNYETCASCPADCGGCCGNGKCDPDAGEAYWNCSDCGYCGNGNCEAGFESCVHCPWDCVDLCTLPNLCNNDGVCASGIETANNCPGDCMHCDEFGEYCNNCGDLVCASWYGETIENCPVDCTVGNISTCGDGTCEYGVEDSWNCSQDCCTWFENENGEWTCSQCGDLYCDTAHGENLAQCPVDSCPTPPVCTGSDPTACGPNCVNCVDTNGLGALCNGGTCSCPPQTFNCVDEFGVKRCTNYAADPSNCGGCASQGYVPRGENCLKKTNSVAGQQVPAPEVCHLGNCGVTACTSNANCATLGASYKCCGTASPSTKACTNVNSQASVVNCGACGNACGQGGNAGRPFCCPSGGTYACSSAPCPPPV